MERDLLAKDVVHEGGFIVQHLTALDQGLATAPFTTMLVCASYNIKLYIHTLHASKSLSVAFEVSCSFGYGLRFAYRKRF